jgi:hypothetical protein
MEQLPAEHDGVPFVPLHGWLQPPQFCTLVFVLISQPSLYMPLQLANPMLQPCT